MNQSDSKECPTCHKSISSTNFARNWKSHYPSKASETNQQRLAALHNETDSGSDSDDLEQDRSDIGENDIDTADDTFSTTDSDEAKSEASTEDDLDDKDAKSDQNSSEGGLGEEDGDEDEESANSNESDDASPKTMKKVEQLRRNQWKSKYIYRKRRRLVYIDKSGMNSEQQWFQDPDGPDGRKYLQGRLFVAETIVELLKSVKKLKATIASFDGGNFETNIHDSDTRAENATVNGDNTVVQGYPIPYSKRIYQPQPVGGFYNPQPRVRRTGGFNVFG